MFDVTADYSKPENKPVRFIAEGRDASATIDSALSGSACRARVLERRRQRDHRHPRLRRRPGQGRHPRREEAEAVQQGRQVARVLDAAARRQRHVRARPLRRRPLGWLRRRRSPRRQGRARRQGQGRSQGPRARRLGRAACGERREGPIGPSRRLRRRARCAASRRTSAARPGLPRPRAPRASRRRCRR